MPVEPPHEEPSGAVFYGVQGRDLHSAHDEESDFVIDVTAFRVTTVLRIVVDRAAEQVRIDTIWTGNCDISLGLRGVAEPVWTKPG